MDIKTRPIYMLSTENFLVVARDGGGRVGEMGEGDQRLQTSRCKVNKSWEYNVQHGDYS